jgi:putative transposase
VAFINDHRELFGVEPICRLLAIAPSSYYARQAIADNPDLASKRAKRDLQNCKDIQRVYEENRSSYGARKVWHALFQGGKEIARCTVERLMKNMNLQGVVRGKKVITTNPDTSAPCPQDKVQRDFNAPHPNFLWVSDFTYVSTWQGTVYVAFVIDVFARRIVGWKVSSSMTSSFVLDALNQAICQRRPFGNPDNKLIHHSDRGSQYLSIKYTERLAEMGIAPSVGSVGDSYDNACLIISPVSTYLLKCPTEVATSVGHGRGRIVDLPVIADRARVRSPLSFSYVLNGYVGIKPRTTSTGEEKDDKPEQYNIFRRDRHFQRSFGCRSFTR